MGLRLALPAAADEAPLSRRLTVRFMVGSDGNQAGRSMSFSFSDFSSALQAGASLEYLEQN
jgi:hypothetical protein